MTYVNRIKYDDNKVKAFNGRSKVAEFDTSDLPDGDYDKMVDALEDLLVRHGWEKSGDTWRDVQNVKNIETTEDSFPVTIREMINNHKWEDDSDPHADEEDKAEEVVRTPTEYYEVEDGETGEIRLVKRLHIDKDQRKRKTPMPTVTEALDEFCIRQSGVRRWLEPGTMEQVAKENGYKLKGPNNGARKMNLQNHLEAQYRKGIAVYINEVKYLVPTGVGE